MAKPAKQLAAVAGVFAGDAINPFKHPAGPGEENRPGCLIGVPTR